MNTQETVVPMIRVVTLLAVVLMSGCSKEEAAPTPATPKVGVATLRTQAVPITTELPGRVVALRTAEVRPQVNGIVQKRLFTEGAEVKAGQQLYQIDAAPYKAEYDSAVAIAAGRKRHADRIERVFKADVVSRQAYDEALLQHVQAQAALEIARINLVYTKVLSPISGRIGRSTITEGSLVTANQPGALAVVQQLDQVYVDATQPSRVLLRLKRELASGELKQSAEGAAQVQLKLEDGTAYPHSGKMQFSEVTVDEGTGSVTLRAVFPNPDRELLPGMFVHERIEEGVRQQAILVPQQGVTHDRKGDPTALVVLPDNKVEMRRLVTDRAIGDQWLVTEGLVAGDRVIVEGLQFAKAGERVEASEFQPRAEQKKTAAGSAAGPTLPAASASQ